MFPPLIGIEEYPYILVLGKSAAFISLFVARFTLDAGLKSFIFLVLQPDTRTSSSRSFEIL